MCSENSGLASQSANWSSVAVKPCGMDLNPASLRRMRPHCETPIQNLILRFLKSSLALSGTALPSELGITLCFRQHATTSSRKHATGGHVMLIEIRFCFSLYNKLKS